MTINDQQTPTWQITSISLLDQALETGLVTLQVQDPQGSSRWLDLNLKNTRELLADGDLLSKVGIVPWRPKIEPIIGKLVADGAGERGGLLPGDRILSANDLPLATWQEWVEFVRARPDQMISLELLRSGELVELNLHTDSKTESGIVIGRIGAYPQIDTDAIAAMRILVRYGPVEGFIRALDKTWNISILTLRVLWKLVTGEASLKNISGPVTIAEFAGVSALIGVSAFLGALAIFSISIGILNLLPVPVLDGGHLLYYFIELVKGSPISEWAEAIGQRIGIAMLAGLMALAFYNDIVRLLG